jgi:toxin HigB-1
MIKSFKHKGLKKFFEQGSMGRIAPDHAPKIGRILGYLDRAKCIEDMNLPGFNLHPLKGDRQEIWSVPVRANWRIYRSQNKFQILNERS